jgi:hypothetical protein
MALSKNLEELLKLMTPEAAKVQRELWEKNPAIAADMEKVAVPQSEFHRQLSAKDEEVQKAQKLSKEWKDWGDKNKPVHEKVVKDLEEAERKNAELVEERTRLLARGKEDGSGDPIDEEKLVEAVQKRIGGKPVTEARLAEIVSQEVKKISDEVKTTVDGERKRFFEETVPAGLKWQADMLEVMQDYRQEYGKKLDKAEFSKFMTENKITDPSEAYEKFTAKDRQEKTIQAEVDKRVQSELAKRNMSGVSSGDTFVTDGTKGPLELHIAGEIPEAVKTGELGDKSAAVAAAKELRSSGAF